MTWTLTLPARIRFGRGTAPEASAAALALSAHVVLVRGSGCAFADRLAADLTAAGAALTILRAAGEPTLPQVIAAAQRARAAGAGVVVAIGGGSVIDLGKAVAALAPQAGDPVRHLEVVGEGAPLDAPPLPLIALPSTAGTGAEATKNAVIGLPDHGLKVSLRDDRLLPGLALVDPALTDGCPRGITLASGMDALVQVIEPYLTHRATPVTDALCRDAIPQALPALRHLMERGEDPGARDAMAHVSLTGGIALANAGLGAVHGLAGVIGGRTGMAHGAICARLLAPVLRANRAALADAGHPVARLDAVLGWIGAAFDVPATEALDALTGWLDANGLPRLPRGDHAGWAAAALGASSMKANPVPLDADTLRAILSQGT